MALLVVSGCGPVEETEALPVESAREALGETCTWDPKFGSRDCFASAWWLEFSTADSAVSLEVEVTTATGTRLVVLPSRMQIGTGFVKFTGGPGSGPVTLGTSIRLRATSQGGLSVRSVWFPFGTGTPTPECLSCTPTCGSGSCGASDGCGGSCACCVPNTNACGPDGCGGTHGACCTPACSGKTCGDDGCGGSCGSCSAGACSNGACVGGCVAPWAPFFQQTASAGSWWAEFQVAGGGSLAQRVSLTVMSSGAVTPLVYSYGRWTAGLINVVAGTQVMLRATDVTGATAQTAPFRYLVDLAPPTDACKGTASTLAGCKPLARGMVSITMDDTILTQQTLALPVMTRYGVKSTIYHVTNNLQTYGLLPMAQTFAAAGHEIASHTQNHLAMTSLSSASLDNEVRASRDYLLANVGTPVESFATPMGMYNPTVQAAIKTYYKSHRTSNIGVNYVGSNVYELSVDGVYNTVTSSAVCALLADAAAKHSWRILVFHGFTTATAVSTLAYNVAEFEAIVACAKATPGLDVVTVRQGVAAIACGSP